MNAWRCTTRLTVWGIRASLGTQTLTYSGWMTWVISSIRPRKWFGLAFLAMCSILRFDILRGTSTLKSLTEKIAGLNVVEVAEVEVRAKDVLNLEQTPLFCNRVLKYYQQNPWVRNWTIRTSWNKLLNSSEKSRRAQKRLKKSTITRPVR